MKVNPNTGDVFFGEKYDGEIDEVRLWSRALLAGEIKKDYTRYLVGNENLLDAYYTFDFLSDSEFFDRSYVGTEYNGNNGKTHGGYSCPRGIGDLGFLGSETNLPLLPPPERHPAT